MGFGDLHDFLDGGDVAIHRIDAFKGHDLGPVAYSGQFAIQIAPVVVTPDHLISPRVAHAFDHAGVVARIRKDHRVFDAAAQSRQGRPVRHIARGEQQGRFLAVQVGQFRFQQQVLVVVARNVARAAGADAAVLHGIDHGVDHIRVLAHAQIVVRTPHRHLGHFAVFVVIGPWERPALAVKLGKGAIVAFGLQRVQLAAENLIKVHWRPQVLFAVLRRVSSSATAFHPAAAAP